MMFIRPILLLSALLFCTHIHATSGFRQMAFSDLNIAVWYPTSSEGIKENAGENPAFVGISVIRHAPVLLGEHPLVVISHGYNGNWLNLSWIAAALADQGYIVVAPNHPGTTTLNQNPVEAKKLWRRPLDITRVIDFITQHPEPFGKIDPKRIAAIGHSLGGWTVMSLAGARFDSAQFIRDCQQSPQRGDCRLTEKLGINDALSQEKREANYRDPRIKAVVSLDLGLAPGFTKQSLRDINIPVLVLAAEADQLADLPAHQESAYLTTHMRPAFGHFAQVKGATHFSFMQLCKPGAEALLNEESPGDDIVCKDGPGAQRADIHQQLVSQISAFLNSALGYQPPVGETTSVNPPSHAGTPD